MRGKGCGRDDASRRRRPIAFAAAVRRPVGRYVKHCLTTIFGNRWCVAPWDPAGFGDQPDDHKPVFAGPKPAWATREAALRWLRGAMFKFAEGKEEYRQPIFFLVGNARLWTEEGDAAFHELVAIAVAQLKTLGDAQEANVYRAQNLGERLGGIGKDHNTHPRQDRAGTKPGRGDAAEIAGRGGFLSYVLHGRFMSWPWRQPTASGRPRRVGYSQATGSRRGLGVPRSQRKGRHGHGGGSADGRLHPQSPVAAPLRRGVHARAPAGGARRQRVVSGRGVEGRERRGREAPRGQGQEPHARLAEAPDGPRRRTRAPVRRELRL